MRSNDVSRSMWWLLILVLAAMSGCIDPDNPHLPEPDSFMARLLLLDGTIVEEGPQYEMESFCGQSFPVYAADASGRRLWLVSAITDVHDGDPIIAWVDTTVRFMVDNGCEQNPEFFGGDNALATHTDPAGDWAWTIHRGEPPAVRNRSSSTDIALGRPHTVELARPYEWNPRFPDDRNGTYWYNGTLTWQDLGEYQIFLENSWCGVPEAWRKLSCS